MKKTSRILSGFVTACFLIVILWINVIAWVHGASGRLAGTAVSFAACLLLVLLLYAVSSPFASLSKGYRAGFLAVILISQFLALLYIAFCLECDVYDTWDFGFLIRTAHSITFQGDILDAVYYARYPNNVQFLQILTLICRLFAKAGFTDLYDYLHLLFLVNAFIISFTGLLIYGAAEKIWGSRAGFISLGLMLFSLPVCAYVSIPYTDIYGLLPVGAGFFLSACLLKKDKQETQRPDRFPKAFLRVRQLILSAALAVVCVIGYRIKASLIILPVAFVIAVFLRQLKEAGEKRESSGRQETGLFFLVIPVFILVFALTVFLLNRSSDRFLDRYGVSAELREQEEFPITHWIMMSLNPKNTGGFIAKDVELSSSVPGKAAKNEQAIAMIKKRAARMGFSGTLYHIFHKKAVHQWMFGSYSTGSYLGRHPMSENAIREAVVSNGAYNRIYRMITQGFYCMLLALSLAGGLLRPRCNSFALSLRLCLIGIFLFYLLWECNARYLVVFHPVFVLLAVFTTAEITCRPESW